MPETPERCKAVCLVSYGKYRVVRTNCGVIQVAAGPVTLHMDATAFRQFTETLEVGVEQLDHLERPHLSVVADSRVSE